MSPTPGSVGFGSVTVSVTTRGVEVDSSGYEVSLDGGTPEAIDLNGSVTFDDVAAGNRGVLLTGQASNCVPERVPGRIIAVAADLTSDVDFTITCYRDPILFERWGGNVDLWVVESDGTFETNLTNGLGVENRIEETGAPGSTWGAGRAEILFTSNRDGDFDVYVMALNKSTLTQYDRPDNQLRAAWSPDYLKIVFISDELGDPDLLLMDTDGSNVIAIATSQFTEWFPSWSPDGSKIAYITFEDAFQEIYVVNADGSGEMNLSQAPRMTDSLLVDRLPSWSPDGMLLAFNRSLFEVMTGDTMEVLDEMYVMAPDGSGLTRITNFDLMQDMEPRISWKHDGTQVAFGLIVDVADTTEQADIHLMDPDGNGLTPLTTGAEFEFFVTWSPAQDFGGPQTPAERIAYMCGPSGGGREVCVVESAGGTPIQLTTNGLDDLVPRWR